MKHLDDHVGYVAGFTIILVAVATGIIVAELIIKIF